MASNTRKVISIDVEDGNFKKFAAAFAAFGAAVKDAISDVGDLDKAQAKAAKTGAKQAAAETKAVDGKRAKRKQAAKESEDQAKKDSEAEKKRVAEENRVELKRKKDRADAVKANKEIAKWTADVALSTGRAALNFAKWMTIGGLAGGFGLGALASSASNARRQSQGLGIDSGELRAAQVNFGKYIDPESMLGGIAEAQSSYGQQYRFGQLGVNAAGKDPAALLAEILPKLVDKFNAVGGKKEAADAMGLTAFASMDDLRRLSKLSREELSKTIAQYQKDREALKVDDAVNQDWQSFLVAIHRAGQVIETSLIKHLAVLAPKLEDFATAVAKSIDTFLSNHDLAKWLNSFALGIQKAADYLGSDKFQNDIAKFMAVINNMVKFLSRWFGETPEEESIRLNAAAAKSVQGYAEDEDREADDALARYRAGKTGGGAGSHNPGNLRVPGSASKFQSFASDDAGLRAMASQLQLYEDRDKLDTIAKIIAKYAPASENDTKAYIANVSQRTGLGADTHLDLHDPATLSKVIAAMTKQENAKSNFTAEGVKIVIQNNTGGNAQQTVAALGGG